MLVILEKVDFSYAGTQILEEADFALRPGERVGLVGPNGTGKTTVLQLIAGVLEPHAGRVARMGGLRIGYLAQDEPDRSEGRLAESLEEAFAEVVALERELEEVTNDLARRPNDEVLLARLGELQHRFEHLGGYDFRSKMSALLSDLGFSTRDLDRPMASFSGGERCRIALVKLLLSQPDVLLLDEPTNHLDILAIENLERILRDYSGTVMLVSHDRSFLNSVATRIVELVGGKLESFPGNYEAYERQRAERMAVLTKEIEKQQALVAKLRDYVARNHAGQKAAQAKSRKRALERLDRIQVPEDPWVRASDWSLHFQTPDPPGPKEVCRLEGVSIGHPGHDPLIRDLEFRIFRGERIGIVGPNGSGKSTFLKVLCGRERPLSGSVKLGEGLTIGFFEQTKSRRGSQATLLDEIRSVRGEISMQEARSLLGRLRFSGDDVFRPVSSLSGGERNRLALGKLAFGEHALLALDEPTNHLDIPARNALEDALSGYQGTLIVVSHDRFFLDRLVDKIFAILPDRTLAIYHGNYSEFRDSEVGQAFGLRPARSAWAHRDAEPSPEPQGRSSDKAERLARRARDKERKRRQRKLERRLAELEDRVSELEAQLRAVEQEAAASSENWTRLQELSARHEQLSTVLEQAVAEWEAVAEELTALED